MNLLYFIPIINTIAITMTGFFPPKALNPGTIRAAIIGSFFLHFWLTKKSQTSIDTTIRLFVGYLFMLSLFSSDYSTSIYSFLKLFLATFSFSVAYYYICSKESFWKLTKFYFYASLVHILSLIIVNIFNLGGTGYSEEGSIYFGASNLNIAKEFVIMLMIAPFIFKVLTIRQRKIFVVVVLVFLVFIFLSLKRTAVLSLILGGVITYMGYDSKIKNLRVILGFIAILALAFPLFEDTLLLTFESRKDIIVVDYTSEEGLETQARYNEGLLTIAEIEKKGFFYFTFGSEPFNNMLYFNMRRMFHTDYINLLAGTGIVGLMLFLLVYVSIYHHTRKLKPYFRQIPELKRIHHMNSGLIVVMLILGVAGTIQSVELRSLAFLYLGASCKYASILVREYKPKNEKTA